jgi:hypothetical protein
VVERCKDTGMVLVKSLTLIRCVMYTRIAMTSIYPKNMEQPFSGSKEVPPDNHP